jgi:hypothetical protein
MSIDIKSPLGSLEWVDRSRLRANNYNPNRVLRDNLVLLTISIVVNGWTMPIATRPDDTIIDGFHRWTVAGPEWDFVPDFGNDFKLREEYRGKTLYQILNGQVPRVIVAQEDEDAYVYGTVTHNRARGQHLLEPMKAIIKNLLDKGKTVKEISVHLGMKPEEVFRLSSFTREDFLKMMMKGDGYSNAEMITKY